MVPAVTVTARSGKAPDGETGQGQGQGQGQESARGSGRGQNTDKSGTWRRPRQDKDKRRRVVTRCFYSRVGTDKLLREEGKGEKKRKKKEVGDGSF